MIDCVFDDKQSRTRWTGEDVGPPLSAKKIGAWPIGASSLTPIRSALLAGGTDVGNVNHAGAAVEVAVNLDLLAYELLGFVLIIQLIV